MKHQPDTAWVDVELLVKSGSGLAWKVRGETGREAWIPVAAIADSEDDLAVGAHTRIEIPVSMAEEKELV